MDSHPLNLAHQQQRRADAYLRYKQFDEAIQCHQNAAELLSEVMKCTISPVALESITLQYQYHLKQKDLIRSRRDQCERVKNAMDNIRQISKDNSSNVEVEEKSKVQVAIYRNLNESSSLLTNLINKNIAMEVLRESNRSEKVVDKSDEKLVAKIQVLGKNLQTLVEQLMLEVEVLKDENITIKQQVDFLERERTKYLNIYPQEVPMLSRCAVVKVNQSKSDGHESTEPPKIFTTQPKQQQENFDLSAFKDD